MLGTFRLLGSLAALICAGSALAGEATRVVQEELRHRHLFYGDVNGRDSAELAAALKRYQERKGFRETGIADVETLRSLGLSDKLSDQDLPNVPVLRSDGALPAGDRAGGEMTAPFSERVWANTTLPSRSEMATYLRQYLDASEGAELSQEVAFYAPEVAYFDHGVVTRTYIRNELLGYRQHWPQRKYELGDTITVGARGDKVSVRFRLKLSLATPALIATPSA